MRSVSLVVAVVALGYEAGALTRGTHMWRVPRTRLSEATRVGEVVESEEFSCCGHAWTLRLTPQGSRRCGVELRYAARDVGDAVDASFTLRSSGGGIVDGGLTFGSSVRTGRG